MAQGTDRKAHLRFCKTHLIRKYAALFRNFENTSYCIHLLVFAVRGAATTPEAECLRLRPSLLCHGSYKATSVKIRHAQISPELTNFPF